MTKHTEGPWVVIDVTTMIHDKQQENNLGPVYLVGPKEFDTIAEVRAGHSDDGRPKQVKANANLIASAPELLSACKEAVRILEDKKEFPAPIAFTLIAYIKQMKDAIAKAEGRA